LDHVTFETRRPALPYVFVEGSLSSGRCGASHIAKLLTSRNIPTPRGGDAWNAMSVRRAMKRLRIAGK